MTARDLSHDTASPETAPEVIPEGPAEQDALSKFTSEGPLPEVAPAAAAAVTAPATASELGFENKKAPTRDAPVLSSEHGMIDWQTFKHDCEASNAPEQWKDEYARGHTEAKGWKQPIEQASEANSANDFRLKKNTSASRALKDFIAGPTITDWRAAYVALELEDLRTEIGDQKFDMLFGSEKSGLDEQIPKAQRLRIAASDVTSRYVDQLREAVMRHDAAEAEPVLKEQLAELKPPDEEEKNKKEEPTAEPEDLVAQQEQIAQQERELV